MIGLDKLPAPVKSALTLTSILVLTACSPAEPEAQTPITPTLPPPSTVELETALIPTMTLVPTAKVTSTPMPVMTPEPTKEYAPGKEVVEIVHPDADGNIFFQGFNFYTVNADAEDPSVETSKGENFRSNNIRVEITEDGETLILGIRRDENGVCSGSEVYLWRSELEERGGKLPGAGEYIITYDNTDGIFFKNNDLSYIIGGPFIVSTDTNAEEGKNKLITELDIAEVGQWNDKDVPVNQAATTIHTPGHIQKFDPVLFDQNQPTLTFKYILTENSVEILGPKLENGEDYYLKYSGPEINDIFTGYVEFVTNLWRYGDKNKYAGDCSDFEVRIIKFSYTGLESLKLEK